MVSAPQKDFFYYYSLMMTNTAGTYTVGQRFLTGNGIGQAKYFRVSDVSDGTDDNLSIIGDIPADNIDFQNGNDIMPDFKAKFIGSIQNGDGLVINIDQGFLGNAIVLLSDSIFPQGTNINVISAPYALECFCAGTTIRTKRGNVAVENLKTDDFVVTASGALRPILWVGHREIHCSAQWTNGWPIRIRAGAFGDNRPARDLMLSPGHPVLVGAEEDGSGGHLVPIMCLINGTTITRVPAETVTYWHVELDQHDILLAEGLPAESYLDWGDRDFFTEGAEHALDNPDFVVTGLAGRCRPVALDGPIVDAERRRLNALFAMGLNAQCVWPTEGESAFGF